MVEGTGHRVERDGGLCSQNRLLSPCHQDLGRQILGGVSCDDAYRHKILVAYILLDNASHAIIAKSRSTLHSTIQPCAHNGSQKERKAKDTLASGGHKTNVNKGAGHLSVGNMRRRVLMFGAGPAGE